VIKNGILGQPYLDNPTLKTVSLSLSHSANMACVLVFPQNIIMGIDIEEYKDRNYEFLKKSLNDAERNILFSSGLLNMRGFTKLWSIKEALSKYTFTGMRSPMNIYSINSVEVCSDGVTTGTFKNFNQ